MHVFLCKENSMTVVAGLSQNLDGDLHVKVDFAFTALLKTHCGTTAGLWCGNYVIYKRFCKKVKKAHSTLSWLLSHLDELLQLGAVLEFSVAVQQQCGVVCIGQWLPVQGLQVRCQVVDPLSIQELSNDIWGFQFPNCTAKRHRGFQSCFKCFQKCPESKFSGKTGYSTFCTYC